MANNELDKKEGFDTSRRKDADENGAANPLSSPDELVNEEIPDLDGDGMIGSTGGFFGGTTYLGSSNTGLGALPDVHSEEENHFTHSEENKLTEKDESTDSEDSSLLTDE